MVITNTLLGHKSFFVGFVRRILYFHFNASSQEGLRIFVAKNTFVILLRDRHLVCAHTHTYRDTGVSVCHVFAGCVPECDIWKTMAAYCYTAGSNLNIKACLHFSVEQRVQRSWKRCDATAGVKHMLTQCGLYDIFPFHC